MISAKRGGVGLFYSAIFFSERNPEMKRKKIGTMDFHGSVDITAPCYNRDVWCRMTNVKIRKGVYTCIAWHHKGTFDNGESYCDDVIGIIGIYRTEATPYERFGYRLDGRYRVLVLRQHWLQANQICRRKMLLEEV